MKRTGSIVLGPKPTKACVNCRRLKMKCEVDGAPPCRRCRHTNAPCIFKPRSNAAAVQSIPERSQSVQGTLVYHPPSPDQDSSSILGRLERIESLLGIGKAANTAPSLAVDSDLEEEPDDVSTRGLWKAVERLKIITCPPQDQNIWSYSIVTRLWTSFLNNLPLLHFVQDQSVLVAPSPLLLASVLYISAVHSPLAELASLASGYFAATCSAIAELVIPSARPGTSGWTRSHVSSSSNDEHTVFQDILGLIMASLSCEAYIETTDKWIALAYRLLLDHCPSDLEDATYDWRRLFSGVQVIDIEHASMHMCYPLLPRQPPIPALQQLDSQHDSAFRGLSQMMHQGLSHFVGRKLPTIWSFVSARESDALSSVGTPFTEKDCQVIRLWAKKLDEWLVQYNGASQPSPSDRQGILILLQYHLHKLYVLSIYHPARGFDLTSANITPSERQELLMSARAVLRLRQDDSSIWSNWDLIMITWAAMLLLRGVEDGMTHQDDLRLIQTQLSTLKRSDPSTLSIHGVLAERLQSGIQSMHTPPDNGPDFAFPAPNMDYSWTIFDQQIMNLANPPWLFDDSSLAPP
ncbi:hypothetical protein IFM51744_00670 [Aspergillus udagawae]|uniref:Zn(2)-C6 fungal-type domain-containing protein n=1 Tax=Aspergillus udagawae TaxID=91492 RepID=A0ABQ1A8K2_9EURO|nr:hypothetical protein IFM51744_00670 [Aspergillus udagawae]GFF76178.1 hypothetical protein IFM53868_01768 [Aspergillus udagawae]GFG03524.1 hypothetical protein IFM5058_01476 [Aspergillus udagawae]